MGNLEIEYQRKNILKEKGSIIKKNLCHGIAWEDTTCTSCIQKVDIINHITLAILIKIQALTTTTNASICHIDDIFVDDE
jgi:hypothetical protein